MYSCQQADETLRRGSTGISLIASVTPQPGQSLSGGSTRAGSDATGLRSTSVCPLDRADVDLLVSIGHALCREPIDHTLANRLTLQCPNPVDEEGKVLHVVAKESVDSLADDLRQRPDTTAEHRRAGSG